MVKSQFCLGALFLLLSLCATAPADTPAGKSAGGSSPAASGATPKASISPDVQAKIAKSRALTGRMEQLFGEGKVKEAIPVAKQALEVIESVVGEEHVDAAFVIHQIGFFYLEAREYENCRIWSERALAIRRKLLGNKHAIRA